MFNWYYSINAIEYFFLFFKQVKDKRMPIFLEFLNHNNFYFLAYNVRWIISKWEILSAIEKRAVIDIINHNEGGMLKNVVFTSNKIPNELLKTITNEKNIYSLPPNEFENLIPSRMIQDCVKILFIDYSFKELPFNNISKWSKILDYYVYKPNSFFFTIALKELFDRYDMHISKVEKKEILAKFKELLSKDDVVVDNWIEVLIMENLTNYNWSRYEEIVLLYYKSLNKENAIRFEELIKSNIQAIDKNNNFKLVEKIGIRDIRSDFDDLLILNMILEHVNNKDSNIKFTDIKSTFEFYCENKKIKLFSTYKIIDNWLTSKNEDFESNVLDRIDYISYLLELSNKQESFYSRKISLEFEKYD